MRAAHRLCFALLMLSFCTATATAQVSAEDAAARKPSTAAANVHVLAPMTITALGRPRTVRIYLPPRYDESKGRYPVLYMHDGQNLFDAATSFLGEWEVDETLNALAKSRRLELIVVGIDNGGEHRLTELAPFDTKNGRAEGDAYVDFIVHVVKPYVDAYYRTKPDRANTAIMGSSLGALISHYAIDKYPGVFGKAGLFSPSYWYNPEMYDYAAAHMPPGGTKLYFYAGGAEDEQMLGNLNRMLEVLRAHGTPAADLQVHVVAGAQHNEAAWRSEFARAVEWLFEPAPH